MVLGKYAYTHNELGTHFSCWIRRTFKVVHDNSIKWHAKINFLLWWVVWDDSNGVNFYVVLVKCRTQAAGEITQLRYHLTVWQVYQQNYLLHWMLTGWGRQLCLRSHWFFCSLWLVARMVWRQCGDWRHLCWPSRHHWLIYTIVCTQGWWQACEECIMVCMNLPSLHMGQHLPSGT